MTSSPLPAPFTSPPIPPSIGDLLYLAAYVFQVKVTAVETMPDTPNQYSAQIKVMGDSGDLDLSVLVGKTGPAGSGDFVLRDQTDAIIVNNVFELPELTDTYNDVGKYWRLDTLDEHGFVVMEVAYVWYGDGWRAFMMGTFGPPGPVPSIIPDCQTIPANEESYVLTAGPTFQPSWQFKLAVPRGPVGPTRPVAFFPDVEIGGVDNLNVLVATSFLESGNLLWQPLRVEGGALNPYSMAENALGGFSGSSQQAPVGSYVIPPQPYPWTPVVWGHIGSIGGQGHQGALGGFLGQIFAFIQGFIRAIFGQLQGGLSAAPLTIGCQVLVGDPVNGAMVARGFGNQTGAVDIYPHYSTPTNSKASITPTNDYVVIPAHHTDIKQGTLYVNLWNEGQQETYHFNPIDAQLFVAVVPIHPPSTTLTGVPRNPVLYSHGALSATIAVFGTVLEVVSLPGVGVLSTTIVTIGG